MPDTCTAIQGTCTHCGGSLVMVLTEEQSRYGFDCPLCGQGLLHVARVWQRIYVAIFYSVHILIAASLLVIFAWLVLDFATHIISGHAHVMLTLAWLLCVASSVASIVLIVKFSKLVFDGLFRRALFSAHRVCEKRYRMLFTHPKVVVERKVHHEEDAIGLLSLIQHPSGELTECHRGSVD